MEKEVKVKEYIERIKEELSYRDYFHAKELCVRASNVESGDLCVKYLREFIEMHKKENGRYEQLDILELCACLYRGREYITAENWESLSAYSECLADEIFERVRLPLVGNQEEYYFVRQCKDSVMHLSNYVERLSEIIENENIEGKSINQLFDGVEKLRNRLQTLLEAVERAEESRKIEEEKTKQKQERDRLINRLLVIIPLVIITFGLLIGTCTGKITC